MTRDEAIDVLKNSIWYYPPDVTSDEYDDRTDVYIAAEMAIEALKQQPQPDAETGAVSCEYCHRVRALYVKPNANGDLGTRAEIEVGDETKVSSIQIYVNYFVAGGFIIIDYCPMCGRKLQ